MSRDRRHCDTNKEIFGFNKVNNHVEAFIHQWFDKEKRSCFSFFVQRFL